jgi:acyl-coenzyme A synthetase/AMP-(fatty) acid ligase
LKEGIMFPTADLGLLPESAAEHHGEITLCADTPWASACCSPKTVSDFAVVVADYADRLWAAGVRPGQVVALVKANHLDIQALQCAIVRIGGLPALLSAKMEPADLLGCLNDLQQPYLVTDADGAAVLRAWQDQLGTLVSRVLTLSPEAELSGAVELDESATHQVTRNPGTARTLITHSSGTTGKPKLAVHTVDSLYNHVADQVNVVQALDYTKISAKCLSFVHVRMSTALLTALNTGVPFLGITSPSLTSVREALLRYRPQSLEAHPNMFLRWEALARETPSPFSPVERYISSFDAIHPRTVRTLLEASDHPNPSFIQAYGQTEVGPVTVLMITRSDIREPGRLNSRDVGGVFPGSKTEVRIVDDGGSVLPAGTLGHIEVRTPARVESLIGRAPLPGRDVWWSTGDIGILRDDGHVELYDRQVDQVPSVPSALRAEDILLDELPELAEVVIVSAGGVMAVASTVDGEPLDEDQWQRARRQAGLPESTRLEYKSWEEFPLTGTLKVRRHRLAPHG